MKRKHSQKKTGQGFQEELLKCNLSQNRRSSTYKVYAFLLSISLSSNKTLARGQSKNGIKHMIETSYL